MMININKKLFGLLLCCALLIPALSLAIVCEPGTQAGDSNDSQLCNPVEKVAGERVSTFIINTLRLFAGVAGIVTIIYVMVSGFQFLISQGNSEKVEAAKKSLQWSLSGLVLIILSFVLISAIRIFFKAQEIPQKAITDTPIVINPVDINSFNELYLIFINGFFGLLGLIAIFIIILNGFRYITSRGNEEQAEQAKQGLQYAVIGIMIIILAYVIVRATASFFGAK